MATLNRPRRRVHGVATGRAFVGEVVKFPHPQEMPVLGTSKDRAIGDTLWLSFLPSQKVEVKLVV